MLVTRSLWREFGLESILDGLAPKTNSVQKAGRLPLADRVLVLVANRLCRPGSEHALAQWLESEVQVGLVMINGWPIAHHVFDGSLRDSETVDTVLKDLQQRFGLRRVILVSDRGMVTIQNLALLRQRGRVTLLGSNGGATSRSVATSKRLHRVGGRSVQSGLPRGKKKSRPARW